MTRRQLAAALLAAAAAPPDRTPVRTGKERLSDKASDEQRADDCKVPPERRGPKPRPDACGSVPPR
jgi:hypothetical protein